MIDLFHYVRNIKFHTPPEDASQLSIYKRNDDKAITVIINQLGFNSEILIKDEKQGNKASAFIENKHKPKGFGILNNIFFKKDNSALA